MLEPRRRRGRSLRRYAVLLLVFIVVAALLVSLRVGGEPEIEITADRPGIGPKTLVTVVAREGRRGPSRVRVELVQGERTLELAAEDYETVPPWTPWAGPVAERRLEIPVGTTVTEGLTAGSATVRVEVSRASTWLRQPEPALAELELPVRLTPPRVSVLSSQHYPTEGGSEAVIYQLSDRVSRHGVEVGDTFFPGFALPGGGSAEQFALFTVPHGVADTAAIRLVAVDDVGHRTERAFVDRLRPSEPRHDTIRVSDGFIERVAPEIEAHSEGLDPGKSLVERYVAINSELRVANRRTIAELAQQSEPRFLWQGTFMPLPNGQVMARFGDRRTYLYDGREVDRQDHLGYDLASVKRAPVPAANAGVVVLARFLGIYGNVVVIDHGYGLMSLYGHLSSFEVDAGQRVERGQTIGRTGETGLAGGDHLHFGIFLHGVATDPVEWLDADWIRNRLLAKLQTGGAGE